MTSAARPLLAGRVLAFTGIILVALNLRTAVGALSPIITRIGEDIALGPVAVGVLGALPPICFALFGIVTPVLVAKTGLEQVTLIAMVAVVTGHLLRGFAPDVWWLLIASSVTFAGLGAGNVLLPPLVKKYFPDRIATMTTIYVTILSISTLVPPLVAVPVADATSWRLSLGLWAAVGAVALIPWVAMLIHRRNNRHDRVEEPSSSALRLVWRSKLAWALALVFAVSALNAYAMFAWLPLMLQDLAGVGDAASGVMLSLFAAMGFPAGLVIPVLASRMRNTGLLVYIGVAGFVLGYGGLLLFPDNLTVLWVLLIGTGPLLFPLALVLINHRSRTHDGAVALSGFVQSVGYIVGACGPLLFGILHQASGGWVFPLLFLMGTAIVAVVAGPIVARSAMVEDGA